MCGLQASRPDRKSSIISENGKKLSMKSHGCAEADRELIGVADTPATFSWQANGDVLLTHFVGFPYRISLIVSHLIQKILRRDGGKRAAEILTLENMARSCKRDHLQNNIVDKPVIISDL
jgi:hypothetical protein